MTYSLRLQRVHLHWPAISLRLAVSRPMNRSTFCRPSRADMRIAGFSAALRRRRVVLMDAVGCGLRLLASDYNSSSMDTLARIKQLAAKEFSLSPDGLDPGAPLDSLGIDSLSFIEFMFKVEEEFGVSVSDDDLKGIKTLGDLERYVAAALAAALAAAGKG